MAGDLPFYYYMDDLASDMVDSSLYNLEACKQSVRLNARMKTEVVGDDEDRGENSVRSMREEESRNGCQVKQEFVEESRSHSQPVTVKEEISRDQAVEKPRNHSQPVTVKEEISRDQAVEEYRNHSQPVTVKEEISRDQAVEESRNHSQPVTVNREISLDQAVEESRNHSQPVTVNEEISLDQAVEESRNHSQPVTVNEEISRDQAGPSDLLDSKPSDLYDIIYYPENKTDILTNLEIVPSLVIENEFLDSSPRRSGSGSEEADSRLADLQTGPPWGSYGLMDAPLHVNSCSLSADMLPSSAPDASCSSDIAGLFGGKLSAVPNAVYSPGEDHSTQVIELGTQVKINSGPGLTHKIQFWDSKQSFGTDRNGLCASREKPTANISNTLDGLWKTEDDLQGFPNDAVACGIQTASVKCVEVLVGSKDKGIVTPEKPYKCNLCPEQFLLAGALEQHNIRQHTETRTYCCDICPDHFSLFSDLKTHKRKHNRLLPGKGRFCCHICCSEFFDSVDLLRHQRKHSGDCASLPYSCEVCLGREKPCGCNTLTESKNDESNNSSDILCSCGICMKKSCTCNTFLYHSYSKASIPPGKQRTRVQKIVIKPYVCEVCEERFSLPSKLQRHEKTHSYGKRYCCHLCPKQFREAAHLVSHQADHTGEIKVKTCNICKKSFQLASDLKKHIMSHMR